VLGHSLHSLLKQSKIRAQERQQECSILLIAEGVL
jgi:hypothetical protein